MDGKIIEADIEGFKPTANNRRLWLWYSYSQNRNKVRKERNPSWIMKGKKGAWKDKNGYYSYETEAKKEGENGDNRSDSDKRWIRKHHKEIGEFQKDDYKDDWGDGRKI